MKNEFQKQLEEELKRLNALVKEERTKLQEIKQMEISTYLDTCMDLLSASFTKIKRLNAARTQIKNAIKAYKRNM